ncbi:FH1/FH2 domain-containing protein 3 [Trichinella sp. T9]|nr:FH1/FH2 domain-containing protein 3 [Trichinella sp. T9]
MKDYNSLPRKFYGYNESPRYHYLSDHAVSKDYDSSRFLGDSLTTSVPPRRSSTGYSNLDPGFSSNYLHSSYGNLLASTPIASQKKYNYSFENIRDKYNEYSPRKSTYSLHSTSSNHRNYSPSHYGSRLTPTRTVWNTHHADLSPPVWSRQSPSAESVKTRLSSENETSSSQTTSSTRGNVAQDSTFKHTDHESSEKLHTDPSECREKNSVKETSSSSSCENSSSEKKARLSSEEEEEEEEEEDYHFDQTIGTELISKDADDPSQASYNSAASQGSDLNKSEEANDADSVKYSESASYESGLSHGTPPWQQFCDYEYTTESDEDKGGDDDESGKGDENVNQFYHLCVLEDEEESAEPAKNNTVDISADDTYVAPPWEQFCDYGLSQEEDDEEDEDDEKRASEKSKDDGTQNLSTYDPSVWNQFCDYSVSQAEEDEQLEKLEVEDSEKSSTSTIPPWQQFCDYNMSADEEVENTSASDASNAWRQFCDYDENTAVPKIDIQLAEDKEQVHQKQSGDDADHLKVAAVPTASESEDTTDDEMPTPVRRISQVQMLSLSPSNSSYAGFSSSDYDSDYETSLDSRDKKYPIFMLKQEQPEERGRVEPHLAQPAPVFSITLDYSECTDEDDAEEEADGDEEEVSEYEDLSDREYSDDDMVMKSALTSSDYSDQFWTLQGEHPETTGLTTDDEDLAVSMRTSPISNDNHAELKQPSKTASPVPSTVEDESKLLMQYADKLHVNDNEALASFTYEQPPALHIASVGELQSDRALLTQTCQPRVGIAEKYDDGPERVSEMATVNCSKSEEPKISLTEIEQKLQYAKQIEERWPSHWADRYEWRRPSVCMAIRRVAKGVAEVARVAPKIQFHFADLKLNLRRASVCQHEIKFVFPELYKPKKPSLALARLSVVPKQPLNTAILAMQPIIRRSERRDSRIPPTTAADVAEQRSQASRKKSLMIERMSEKFKDGPPAPLLPSVSTAPVPKQAPKSEEPSFEQQLEELRRKMHLGASQFSEQAKSLSRGIGEGTSSRKLAAQSEVTRSLMSEATNLRQKASEQCEQLKQSKLDKNQSISSDKSRTARAVPSPRSEIAENEAKSLESPKSVPTDTRKSTTTIRQPQKVASPFFHKEKQEVMANQELERSKEALNRKRQELKAAEAAKAAVGKAKEAEVSPLATTDGHAKSVEQAKQPTGVASVGVGKQRPTESTAQLEQSTIASKRATAGCSPVPATAQPKQMVAVGKQKPVAQVAQVQKSSIKRGEMVDQGSASDVKIHSTPVKDEAAVIRQAKQPVYAQLVGIRGSDVKQQAQVVVPKLPLTKPFKWKRPKAKSHHRRNNRLISSLRDIDELLGLKNRIKTFDQFEVFLGNCAKDIRRREQNVPPTGAAMWSPRKIYIYADAVDADVVFYSRKDLQQLLELFSPSSKITFNYDFSEKTMPTSKWANHFSNIGRPQNRGTSKSKRKTVMQQQPLRRNCDDDDNDDDEDDRLTIRVQYLNDKDPFATAASCLEPALGRSFRFSLQTTLLEQLPSVLRLLNAPHKVEDAAMQIVSCQNATPVDYGNYLDLDMSLVEQPDELAVLKERAGLRRRSSFTVPDAALINPSAAGLSGYSTAREQATTSSLLNSFIQQQNGNNIVVRTQLSCRVHTIIEKLLNSTGRDLRRILFSLKQIFQDDKDLVHEFVQNDGLACLIKVGAEADQNYQNYILRALGQVMLYVDGMNGVIAHNETIQWLYSLLGSQFRLVVKTALKLLLVFVKYTESNSLLLLAAVYIVDRERGVPPWSHVMGILNDKDCGDTELLVYAMTLLNRSLNGVPDQDTYYDIVDALEEQGMEATVRHLQSLRSRELSEQCRMYEAMLDKEDSEEVATSNGGITTKRAGTRTGHNSGDRRSSGVREKVQPDQEVTCRVKKLASNLENAESAEPKTAGLSEKKKLSMDLLYKNNSNSINNNNVPEEIQPTNGERLESQKAPPSRPVLAPPPALPDLTSLDSAVEQPKQRIGAVHSLAVKYQQQQKPDVEPSPAGSKVEPTAANDDESSAQPGGGGGDTFANALSRARKGMEKKLAAREAIDTRKESEIQWEKALQNLNRPLIVNDLDFTELNDADDQDPLRLVRAQEMSAAGGGVDSLSRPPPPPLFAQTLGSIPGPPPPPPPQAASTGGPPPPPPVAKQESGMGHRSSTASRADRVDSKTVKLHWKEAQCKPLPGVLDKDGGIFWQKVKPVAIDTEKLGNLFVTKTKELAPKKKDDKKLEIRVLDTKRSNAINIGLTKLPPPRAIKTAVLKFDSSIMNKECIEKVLSTMMPTAEEQEAIAGAQAANPDLPLGSAEQFLLMLSEIPQLHARLRLWLFMLDYANVEREVAEPLMDLKLAMEELDKSRTFKQVMATLLAVGNFLNGAEVRGFQIDYLAKVPEVKDTVHKHSLVYHLASIVLESFPDSTDLYSEMGAVARSAKVDFDEVKANLEKLEKDCKSSWDYLRVVAKHESHSLKEKISGFLTDCAQRILTLKIIHKRVINRFRKFLLYMGMPQPAIKDTKINTICKTISEFALEYRTCREKILQQKKRLQDKRERNKTRGKLITDAKSWTQRNNPTNSSSTAENANAQKNHEELSKVLKSTGNADASWNLSYPGSRTRQKITQPTAAEVRSTMGEAAESPDDEILDGLVKAATTTGDHPREYRRRARQFNRKSLRRTRTLKLVDDQINGTY